MSVQALLTYPETDYDGDFVQPDGGDWGAKFKSHPLVNWWHELPVGRGAVEMKSISVDGKSWDVPVGTTQFFRQESDTRGMNLVIRDPESYAVTGKLSPTEAVKAAADAFRLVADDVATGVSLEFQPDPDHTRDTGRKSLTRGRPGRRYERWVGLGWAHTPEPANPNANTILDSVAKAIRVAETGRHSGGQALSDVVRKSLSRWASTLARPKTVTVPRTVRKAMDDDLPDVTADTPTDDAMATTDPAMPVDDGDTPAEAARSYDAAQAVSDAATMLRDVAAKTLDDKTHKALMRCAENLESEAEDLVSVAEGVEQKLASRGDSGTSETAEEPSEDTESDTDSVSEGEQSDPVEDDSDDDDKDEYKSLPRKLERSADGAIVIKSRYKPRRLKLSDLGEPTRKAKATSSDDALLAQTMKQLRDLERQVRRNR